MRYAPWIVVVALCGGVAGAQENLDALNTRVGDLYGKGDYAGATKVAEQAVNVAERQFGRDAVETATLVNNLAELYRAQGKYAEAEPLYKRALAINEKALGPDHPETATNLNNIALLYGSQGKHAEAEPLYKRVVTIFEKALGPDHPITATSLNNLAELYRAQGKYAEAEPPCRRALAICEKALGQDHPDTAGSLNNLAQLYQAQGKYAQAEPLYKRSMVILERALGPDHPYTATSLNNLALLYRAQGKFAEAEPPCKRALVIREKAAGPDHPDTAQSLNNLAQLYRARGQYAQAEPLYKRSMVILEKALGPDHPYTATSLNNLAVVYEFQGKYAEAEPLYKRALAIDKKALGPDHPDTAIDLNNLAALEIALGRFAEGAEFKDEARRGARRHVARVLASLSAAEQAVFLRTQDERDFHGALTIGLLQKSRPEIAALSAGWLANGKAVAQEAASQQIILARQSTNPATRAAVTGLEKVRADLAQLAQVTPEPNQAAAYRAKVAELQAEEQRLVHEIGGQLAALDRDEPWVEIDAIRKSIPAGSVLVDIARFGIFDFAAKGTEEKWRPPRYAAWIVPPAGAGDVTIVDLGPAEEIDAAVKTYREAIDVVQKGGFARGQATAEEELTITAAPLATKVLQPIIAAIGDATDIILSPDGSLWLVPWQALPLADGSYAIEKFAILTVTSARDLVPVPVKAAGGKGGPVVVADPAFDAAPPASGKPTGDATRALAPAVKATWKFSPLPGTRAEALATKPAIAKVAGGEPKVLLGADASETKLKQAAVRPASLVLATHGFFKPDQQVKQDDRKGLESAAGARGFAPVLTTDGEPLEDPLLRCGLALAGANAATKSAADDGILTGAEIVGLDLLGTDLVVLSACETGVGQVQNGEGVAGLRQAFQIAGAKTVVATLWQIPDAESSQIMQAFYANLTRGDPASKALRDAQLAFIEARREDRNYEAAHPYLWAAYGVTGR